MIAHSSTPANERNSGAKKRRLEEAEKYLSRGKKMVRASLKPSEKNGEEGTVARKALRRKVHASGKPKESDNKKFREISAANTYHGVKVRQQWNFWYLLPGQVSRN